MAFEKKTTMVMKKVKQMSGVHIDELLNRVERVERVVVKELMQSAANSDRQVNRLDTGDLEEKQLQHACLLQQERAEKKSARHGQ
ncbi:unnamed protein product [Sphagnum tenellum]